MLRLQGTIGLAKLCGEAVEGLGLQGDGTVGLVLGLLQAAFRLVGVGATELSLIGCVQGGEGLLSLLPVGEGRSDSLLLQLQLGGEGGGEGAQLLQLGLGVVGLLLGFLHESVGLLLKVGLGAQGTVLLLR